MIMATAETAAQMPGMAPGQTPTGNPTPLPPSFGQQISTTLARFSQKQKMAAAAVIALVIALIVGIFLWTREAPYSVLFSNLDERDGGAIVESLQQQNILYRMSDNGLAILVPTHQVHETRLRMAAAGLPKGGLVGFELLENQKLGISQFHEQVSYQRALEGELARTIQSIASVDGARVHLAMPRQTAFLRDEQRPTASVMVNLRPGRFLEASQVAGIVHLVSSSVPRMSNEGVQIVDQNGNLLTQKDDPTRKSGLDANQLRYIEEIESGYVRRIETILSAMVGGGNFRAQVAADIDFNQTEQTSETYRPNPAPEQAIRSQQTQENFNNAQGPYGIPGALTNQPPAPATAPINLPAGVAAAQGAGNANGARSATINYELDRTIQHVRQATGQIRRLSVAVVVNHRNETLPDGQVQRVPLTDDEVLRIRDLVREAVGINQDRGDSLSVAASAFAPGAAPEQLPFWKQPEMIELAIEALKYIFMLLALLAIIFGIVRPLLRAAFPPPPPPVVADEDEETLYDEDGNPIRRTGDAEEEGDDVDVALSGETPEDSYEAQLARVKELARNNPKIVANLVKEWMGVNEDPRRQGK
jgi:flagellar M-ring protein FliF